MQECKLLNLIDMQRIYADKIAKLAAALAEFPATLRGVDIVEQSGKPTIVGGAFSREAKVRVEFENPRLSDRVAEPIEAIIETSTKLCTDLDLRVSLKQVERLGALLTNDTVDLKQASQVYWELYSRITDELETGWFFKFDLGKEYYYQADDLFGPDVAAAFPSASYDLQEAGACFACDRWTASVFHLMRALEIPLKALAGAIDAPIELRNWNQYLNDFDKSLDGYLKANARSNPKPQGWKETEPFYSEAAALLRNVKNAWRNSVNHAEKSYDEPRAKAVLNSVEAMMQFLATKVREPGSGQT